MHHAARPLASGAVVTGLGDEPGPTVPLPSVTVRGIDVPIRIFRLDAQD